MMAWMALAPAMAWGQNPGVSYAPPSSPLPVPIGSTRPEDGGFFVDAQFTFFHMTNPLKPQQVAVRGLIDRDGTIAGQAGQFLGSGQEALNVSQLTKSDTYVPGTNLGMGWKFRNGSSLSVNFLMFAEASYRAGATLIPRAGTLDPNFANSFLFADVHNIPPQFAGPDFKVLFPFPRVPVTMLPLLQPGNHPTPSPILLTIPVGLVPFPIIQPSPQAAFGIWNGASIMTIDFTQRFQQWDLIYREPIFETETYRLNGMVGPRFAWIWERFAWRTTSIAAFGNSGPADVGLYSTTASNRMYGAAAGCEQEYYLGHGVVLHLKLQGSLFVDIVKENAKYESGDKFNGLPENKRAKNLWSFVPEADTTVGIMWYPTEFVQLYAGYEVMGFLNTLAGRRPIDFDYSNLDPHYSHTARLFNGFHGGIAFTF